MSDYIRKSTVIELIESKMTDGCLGTEEDTFIGGHGLVDDISDLPTLDEKEIIRKTVERIVERLEDKRLNEYSARMEYASCMSGVSVAFCDGYIKAIEEIIEICKEVGGRE